MNTYKQKFKVRLGIFVAGGLALFVLAIFIIGKQKNLFNSVIRLTTNFFNVSGLQSGNNIRFAGINVGTVENMINLKSSSRGLDENMEALKHNFLFKGYYNKKNRQAEKLNNDSIEKLKDKKQY